MRRYPAYIFDLDGTVYRGNEVLPYAAETIATLKAGGRRVAYLTNNSSQTQAHFAEKLSRMGIPTEPHDVVSTATGAAAHMTAQGMRTAFVIGEPGLVATLREARIAVVNALANGLIVPQAAQTEVDAVVVGICRHFDYALLDGAMNRIRAGAEFIATNRDNIYPLEGDRVIPGTGSIVAAVATCSEREPFLIGKPRPFLVEVALSQLGVAAGDTLVVGDRYDTDILSGQAAGCDTYLVLTGITKEPPAGQPWGDDLRGLVADA